jgi:hypothetical protein
MVQKRHGNPLLISGGWPFPWVRAPRGPLQIPELFGESWGARPGENNGSFGTVHGLKSDTAPSPKKYAISRLMHCSELPLYSIISSLPASNDVARGDLFGAAAERFRVGLLRARVDDWVIRGVNAACHVGWQEPPTLQFAIFHPSGARKSCEIENPASYSSNVVITSI